jgi:hypothetical protein
MAGPDHSIRLSTSDFLVRANECLARSHVILATTGAMLIRSDACIAESRLLVVECRSRLEQSRNTLGADGPTWFLDRATP